MKKLLALLLTIASLTLATCDAPPAETTNSETTTFEETTTHTLTALHDGLALWVKSLCQDNGDLILTVGLRNDGEIPVSQSLDTFCREFTMPHNHELETHFSDGEGHVIWHDQGDLHPAAMDAWTLFPGEEVDFELTLLPRGFALDDPTLYVDGSCEFSGTVSFSYYMGEETAENLEWKNDRKITTNYAFTLLAPTPVSTSTTLIPELPMTEKPVIYLYPEKETEVTVRLDYKGELLCTYPAYENGWRVLARPDGTLTNLADGREYSYLFWDGYDETAYDLSRGFCVKGEDTAAFLQDILGEMGLTPREYNEFIVYWLPRMQNNPYNLITFQEEAYTDTAPLTITPAPDSILRVFMVYQPLTEYVEVEAPEIKSFAREGFTVVEWGGKEVN